MSRPFAPLTQETFELRGEKENLFMRSFTAFHWISEETGFRNLPLC